MSTHLSLSSTTERYSFAQDGPAGNVLLVNRLSGSITTASKATTSLSSDAPPQRVYGILGMIQLKLDRYVLVIAGRRSVGRLGRDDVFCITKVDLLPLRFKRISAIKDEEELEYIALLKAHIKTGPFYYSHTLDLTNSLQRQTKSDSSKPLWARSDERFFWNRYAQTPLIDARQKMNGADMDTFILPIVYGFLEIKQASIKGKRLTFALLSRRSRHRAGTRYFTRGIDTEGHVANYNETEQLVLLDPKSDSSLVDGHVKLSYVQTRGSVPAFWAEVNDLKYKPRMRVFSQLDAVNAAKKHFEEQLDIYGEQFCVNLVNQKGHELPVKSAYEDVVRRLGNREIHYIYFDFHHECKGMRWDRVQLLIDQLEADLVKQGYCHVESTGSQMSVVQKQSSVIRTNCMDCLDRTNVVQSALARWTLTRQLRAVGVLGHAENVSQFADFESSFRNMWADNANIVSQSYSGTGALKTDFTRTGKRTKEGAAKDGWNSAVRYILNNYADGPRQDAYDLFLGRYQASEIHDSPFGDFRPVFVQTVPYIAWSAFLMIVAALVLPRSPNAWGSLKVFALFWTGVLGWSLTYLFSHGLWYVNWPKLNTPDFVFLEPGCEGVNSRAARLRSVRSTARLSELEAGKAHKA